MEPAHSARHGRSRAPVAWVLLAGVAAVLAACGETAVDEGGTVDLVPEEPVVLEDRESVIEHFGLAMVRGDAVAMDELLEPRLTETTSAAQRAALESIEPPTGVTVTDFGHRIVGESEDSVEVEYTGERCAPSTSKQFGPTTVTGGPGDGPTSMASDGVVVEGEIECYDLSTPGPFTPVTFVQVDGRWYATFPGF